MRVISALRLWFALPRVLSALHMRVISALRLWFALPRVFSALRKRAFSVLRMRKSHVDLMHTLLWPVWIS
jgi:hypothetical protein